MSRFHELSASAITGEEIAMGDYEGTVTLIVNVASR